MDISVAVHQSQIDLLNLIFTAAPGVFAICAMLFGNRIVTALLKKLYNIS